MAYVWSQDEMDRWVDRHSDAWHDRNREDCEHCQKMIEWYGPMPEKLVILAWARKGYRAAKHQQKYQIPEAIRWQVWERDNFTCQHCGSRKFLSVDHIVAESKGGANEISNFQTLCRSCNGKKGAR